MEVRRRCNCRISTVQPEGWAGLTIFFFDRWKAIYVIWQSVRCPGSVCDLHHGTARLVCLNAKIYLKWSHQSGACGVLAVNPILPRKILCLRGRAKTKRIFRWSSSYTRYLFLSNCYLEQIWPNAIKYTRIITALRILRKQGGGISESRLPISS